MAHRGRKPAVPTNVVAFTPTGAPAPKKRGRPSNPLKHSSLTPSPHVLADEKALDKWAFYLQHAPHLRPVDGPMLNRLCMDESISSFILDQIFKIRPRFSEWEADDVDGLGVLITQFNKLMISHGTTAERIRKTQSELGLTPTTVDRVSGTSSKGEGSGIQQWL